MIRRAYHQTSLSLQLRGSIILTAFVLLALPRFGMAQSAGKKDIPKQPEVGAVPATAALEHSFEVASVRPNKSDCSENFVSSPSGRFLAHCNTFLNLLINAYPIGATIPGLPGWAHSARFDVDAKADDKKTVALQKLTRAEQWNETQLMLRMLLADRFKLRVHYETRQGAIYNLVLAKGGFKLKEGAEGARDRGYSYGNGHIQVRNGPIGSLAFSLSDLLGRQVVDHTGLNGKYEIELRWTPDELQGTADAGPTLFTALEEQLGLKLISAKGPVKTFVVDHVERPSEN